MREVSLEIAAGESVAIVGESGSGKSTLLRVVAGLVAPDSPAIQLADAHRVQMVFQDAGASLTPWLRVGEQIGEASRQRAGQAARVTDTMQAMGLPAELVRAKPAQL